MTRIVLNAYWPQNERAQTEEVIAEAKKGAQSLERGHMKNFAGLVLERLRKTDIIQEEITRMRHGLAVERTTRRSGAKRCSTKNTGPEQNPCKQTRLRT